VAISDIQPELHKYPLQFLSLTFPELLGTVDSIEAQIEFDAYKRVLEHIADLGAEVYGGSFRLDDALYRIDYTIGTTGRNLTVIVQDIARNSPPRVEGAALNEFGPVSDITLIIPEEFTRISEAALSDVRRILEAAYRALEEAFLTLYLRWRFSLLDEIYAITNSHLRIIGNDSLIGRYWFSVTDMHTKRFRYQFDRQSLERGIQWFKQNGPDARTCGLYGLTSLILEEPDDGVFAADTLGTQPRILEDDTVILKLARLPHIRDRLEFAISERQLFSDDEMACLDVVTLDEVSLQLNCPASNYQAYAFALQSAARDISSQFTSNHKRHQKDLREMDKTLKRLRSTSSGWLQDLGTDFAAKLAAELMSG
jgi:hypothetical protein